MIEEKIKKIIKEAVMEVTGESAERVDALNITIDHPKEIGHGDYSFAAMKIIRTFLGTQRGLEKEHPKAAIIINTTPADNPMKAADQIVRYIVQNKPKEIERVEVAGPGFINFYLSPEFLVGSVAEIIRQAENFGRNDLLAGKKIMVDYTDPNPFKEFHIGHLMSNTIGEAICRIFESNGAKVVRVCYQGDVGLHVAKAIWGILQNKAGLPADNASISEKTKYLGSAYVLGSQKYADDPKAIDEIKELNKKLFEKSDAELNALYEKGRSWSLLHFDEIYKKLGTEFNHIIPESSVIVDGQKIVEEFLDKGVFEKSDGAVVFKGEKYGLHTRVFISSQGLPTYETKDMGLAKKKRELEKDLSASIIITGNEQNDYFNVIFKVLSFIFPEYAKISKHIGHGMLRFATGKMSSRAGNVITGESLISAVEAMVREKIEGRELLTEEKNKIAEQVAIGAIKYSILRQATGGDIIYDFEKSISFEGDSGPYLQYSYVRALSILVKVGEEESRIKSHELRMTEKPGELERMLYRFPEIVERAGKECEPHHLATYLIELASLWNNYYANNKIIGAGEAESYRLMLARAFSIVMKNGLGLLGIQAPNKM